MHETPRPERETLVGFLGKRQFRYAFQDVDAQARLVRAVIASGNKRADITRVYESTGHAQHARAFMKHARRMAAKDGLNLDALAGVGQPMNAEPRTMAHAVDAAVQDEDQLLCSVTAIHAQQPIEVDACRPHALSYHYCRLSVDGRLRKDCQSSVMMSQPRASAVRRLPPLRLSGSH